MNQAQLRTPWLYCKALLSLACVASNSSQNHAAVDRTGYQSLIADATYSASGAPTGGTVPLKLQDWAAGTPFAESAIPVAVALAPAGGLASLPMPLGGARQFVRVVSVAAPTGGTSPVVTL